ncbi:ABC transporter substrate-binding protein [Thermogladius sp. KZ2Tp1]|uniref:ABC transporter substrate-binding protein n=1 Tax=Thermogladius sp. KZ2Tp1 TaxID=3136289 RepID=UPI003DA9C557
MCLRRPGVLVLVAALVLASILPVTQVSVAQATKVFRVGWGGTSFDTFNPFTTYATISVWLTLDVYSRLVRPTENYTGFVPDLAESWEVKGDSVTFNLVHNATFTDGYPVTAEDVAYSYYLANQSWSSLSPYVAMVKDIKVVDNYTVEFYVTSPTLFMLEAAINVPIVPKHIWANVSDPSTYPDNPPIGSGPLKVAEFKEGQYAVLEPNPNFYYPSWLPKVDRIIVKFYSDVTSATNALLAGDIDAVGPYIASTLIKTVANNPNLYLFKSPPTMFFYLAFNVDPNGTGNPTLRDPNVRLALAHAINVSYVCGIGWPGAGEPMGTVMPSTNIFADKDLKPYSFNLTLAAQILDQAGYKLGADGVRASPSGVRLEYNLLVPSNMPEAIKAAQVIAQWWGQIGVKASVQPMDTGSMSAIIWKKVNDTIVLGHDTDIWDWFVAPNDVLFLNVFLSGMKLTGVSDSGYANPVYDATFEKLYNATSLDELKSIAYSLQEMLHNDLPYIPLCEVWAVQAHSKAFTGFDYDWPSGPFGGSDWRTFLNAQLAPSSPSTTTYTSTSSSPVATETAAPTATSATTPTPQSPPQSGAQPSSTWLVVGVVAVAVVVAITVYALKRR